MGTRHGEPSWAWPPPPVSFSRPHKPWIPSNSRICYNFQLNYLTRSLFASLGHGPRDLPHEISAIAAVKRKTTLTTIVNFARDTTTLNTWIHFPYILMNTYIFFSQLPKIIQGKKMSDILFPSPTTANCDIDKKSVHELWLAEAATWPHHLDTFTGGNVIIALKFHLHVSVSNVGPAKAPPYIVICFSLSK